MKKTLGIIISGLALIAGLVLVAPAEAATDVLPDLRSPALADFRIENASNGEKRLRFSTRIANAGPGKFEIRMYRPNTTTAQMKVNSASSTPLGSIAGYKPPAPRGSTTLETATITGTSSSCRSSRSTGSTQTAQKVLRWALELRLASASSTS
jgi:hypothetical protein